MPYIQLSGKRGKGKQTLVDDDIYAKYGHLSWHLSDTGYAVRRTTEGTIRLHRIVAGTPEGKFTDHKNHDRLDNRRSNLRIVTQKENMANSQGKGYTWDASKARWMVRYRRKFYGRYSTEAEAVHAYKLACSGVPYVTRKRKLYNLPTGISKQFGLYRARPQVNGKKYWLGAFQTLAAAEHALRIFKSTGEIVPREAHARKGRKRQLCRYEFDRYQERIGRKPHRIRWAEAGANGTKIFNTEEEGKAFMEILNSRLQR
jgi:hypothetical protein